MTFEENMIDVLSSVEHNSDINSNEKSINSDKLIDEKFNDKTKEAEFVKKINEYLKPVESFFCHLFNYKVDKKEEIKETFEQKSERAAREIAIVLEKEREKEIKEREKEKKLLEEIEKYTILYIEFLKEYLPVDSVTAKIRPGYKVCVINFYRTKFEFLRHAYNISPVLKKHLECHESEHLNLICHAYSEIFKDNLNFNHDYRDAVYATLKV